MKLPTIRGSAVLARSRFFRVEELDLEFSNGAERVYERLPGMGQSAVMVVALKGEGSATELVLINEYCAGVHDYVLTFPKGRAEGDESLEHAGNRELMEEAGFGARNIQRLRSMTLAPAQMGYSITVLLARDLYPEKLEGDEPEPFEVILWPFSKLDELVLDPRFSEGRAIAALKLVQIHLENEDA